jgi:hypothetical protein
MCGPHFKVALPHIPKTCPPLQLRLAAGTIFRWLVNSRLPLPDLPVLLRTWGGCGGFHSVTPTGPGAWGWNGDLERPVLSPSMLIKLEYPDKTRVCHTFVGCNGAQPGEIIFLSDCTDALAGKVRRLEWTEF